MAQRESAAFVPCPSCGNGSNGYHKKKCIKCGTIFCGACPMNSKRHNESDCPKCGNSSSTAIYWRDEM